MLFEDRARAESFGAIADLYDRARPSYPPRLIDALLADGPRRVLDVGCGTGIAGALLAARGAAVLGVEVDPRMAAVARAKGLEVEVARFEDWDPGARRFDRVICAQAWHWVEPQAGAARAAAVLRRGGRLCVFWNFGDPPAHVRARLAPVYAGLEPGLENYSRAPGGHRARVEGTLANLAASPAFDPPELATFTWTKTYSTADWLDHLDTHSDHQALPAARRRRLLAAVGEAIDAVGGAFELPYDTVLVGARRSDG